MCMKPAKPETVSLNPYPDYPEREGAYFVDSVTTEFGTKGFKRIVELGQKAS